MKLTKRQTRKLFRLVFPVFILSLGVGLILYSMEDTIIYFYTPTKLKTVGSAAEKSMVRIGGLVKEGSVEKEGEKVSFIITDGNEDVPVRFVGPLPGLFREGQGIVVLGKYNEINGVQATEVLAKHDENYMPPEVVAGLKEQGYWQHADPEIDPPLDQQSPAPTGEQHG